jgi:hypothetical protein
MIENISKFNAWMWGIFFLIFLWSFTVFDIRFRGPDEPIYYAYTASVVQDGDLNAVNQFYPDKAGFVSRTFNLPDFHNHGATVFWVPFYLYGRLFGSEKAIKCVLSLSSVLFGFFTLLLTFFLCHKFFREKISFWSTVVMFIGTPYFYFTLFEPGNGQIIASLLSVISILVLFHAPAMRRWHWFFYGMFFSLCVAVKLDLWFQVFLIALCLLALAYKKEAALPRGRYFIFGFLPIFVLNLANDYIKYGRLHKGELYLFNPHNFYFFEQLFSSYRGYFYTSPIFYLSLCGFLIFIFSLYKKNSPDNREHWKSTLLFSLGAYLFIKLFIISFRYAWGGGTTGARQLLTEFPVFVLFYAYALENQKRFIRYLLCALSLLLVFWNLMVIAEFITRLDLKYLPHAPALAQRINSVAVIFDLFSRPEEMRLKLRVCAAILCAIILAILFFIRQTGAPGGPLPGKGTKIWGQAWALRSLPFISLYAFFAYSLITGLNIFFNKKNVENLKARGFFDRAVILSSRDYERQENSSSMDEMINYFSSRDNPAMVERIKRTKKDIYGD